MRRRLPVPTRAWGLLALSTLYGCTERSPTDPLSEPPVLAKGGNSQIEVTATDPTEATQDTTLDVRVFGAGFDNGSVATFLLDRKVTPKVVTNSTHFVDSTELVANITIAIDADVALYDVEVESSGSRRRGIGTDLFAVKQKTNGGYGGQPTSENKRVTVPTEVRTGVANMILPDTFGPYDGGVCGVRAVLVVNTGSFKFRPIQNFLNKKAIRDLQASCPEFPRRAWFDLESATVHIDNPLDTLDHLRDVSLAEYIQAGNADPIAPDPVDDPLVRGDDRLRSAGVSNLTAVPDETTEFRGSAFNLNYCLDDGVGGPFLFNTNRNPGSDSLTVERAGDVFHVRTQPFPYNVGSCEHTRSDGTGIVLLLHMDLAYDITPIR